ncbi:MAG TPA: class I SAM-dependent methyltransferase [Thermoleophilaceae bacterium]|nr:class I SAM-dependent methyltransferase [Thermoleophilaceae bacterium]
MGESAGASGDLDALLAEQRRYYGAVAPEYEDHAIPGAWGGELLAALDAFRPAGDVLELACGPGTWTQRLLRHAASIVAVDASHEMLAIARQRISDRRVRFLQADLFEWRPNDHYDVVFFGFWLSHVPAERFEPFWSLVADCLRPDGRVFFTDDAHRTTDELAYGDASPLVRRTLNDGSTYRVVKVPHLADQLEQRLRGLGWDIRVEQTSEPFYWGAGSRKA